MDIVAVDRWLLQLVAVDEDESEAVAISCVEFLLSETNVYYRQHCLTRDIIQSVSSQLRDNVLDTVFAALLDPEQTVGEMRFQPESKPEAETKDRHATRSVPSKSLENLTATKSCLPSKASSSRASRTGSLSEKTRSRVGILSTHRKAKAANAEKVNEIATLVQIMEREEDVSDEKPEIKKWRDDCLKSLDAATRKPGFAKWANLARVFAVPESRVSIEVGVFGASTVNDMDGSETARLCMKTNVHVLSSSDEDDEINATAPTVQATRQPPTLLHSSAQKLQPMSMKPVETLHHQSNRRTQVAKVSDIDRQQQHKAAVLKGSLAQRKSIQKTSSAMSVASGMVFLQGESVFEGSESVDGITNISRKRFDLQQRLATDALLNSSLAHDLPRLGSPLRPGHNSDSPLSHMHCHENEKALPEPIQIATSTLAIPRTHLSPSLSTPSLRVRTCRKALYSNVDDDCSSVRSICTIGSGKSGRQDNPQNLMPQPRATATFKMASDRAKRATSRAPKSNKPVLQCLATAKNGAGKYLREFPKPQAGVIRIVDEKAVGLLSDCCHPFLHS